jgi:hypothetical protein
MSPTDQAYLDVVHELMARSDEGDELATRAIAAMSLLSCGWHLGDPEPPEWQCQIIDLADVLQHDGSA